MKKEVLEINGKQITIMEQPAKFVLDLERKYGDNEVLGYVKEVLKYPEGVNPGIESLIDIPSVVSLNELDIHLNLISQDKIDFNKVQSLFFALKENKLNPAYLGERVVKLCGKSINDYKYKDLVYIGTEVFKQIGEFAYLIQIRESFRNM